MDPWLVGGIFAFAVATANNELELFLSRRSIRRFRERYNISEEEMAGYLKDLESD